jgi:uncharacterized membrane protein (DUF2068 family)
VDFSWLIGPEMENGKQVRPKDRLLTLIVLFKYFKGVLLIAVALGAHHLVNRDVGEFAERLVDSFRVDPDNRYIHVLLEKAQVLNAKELKELSIGSFFYAAIVTTEGTGLALRKRWAEYFTIIVTASFLPLEVYELMHRVTPVKVMVMAINLAILGYLIGRVVKARKAE